VFYHVAQQNSTVFRHCKTKTQNVSLDDYISRMKEGQEKIYFVTADSLQLRKTARIWKFSAKKASKSYYCPTA
jgi:molecular chaperone HtpG